MKNISKSIISTLVVGVISSLLYACNEAPTSAQTNPPASTQAHPEYKLIQGTDTRLNIYHKVDLKAELSHLSQQQKDMLIVLIEASEIMDDLFWKQAFGQNRDSFLTNIEEPKVRDFIRINYGPWDRLAGDKPLLTSIPPKALGAQFYPDDMTKQEFEQANFGDKNGLYSIVQRNDKGQLYSTPYSEFYVQELTQAATLLRKAAGMAEDKSFAEYLNLRATALLANEYQASDFAWMDMKTNPIELVYGPIETYEDQLYGYRAAFEAYVLIKDLAWSEKLKKYAAYLPELQKGLPVEAEYKAQMPGANADLNAYDVIYYAGHSNAGSKTIAINLPNDEEVQLQKGTRRLDRKSVV